MDRGRDDEEREDARRPRGHDGDDRNGNVIADAAAGVDDLTQAALLMLHEGLERHRDYPRLLVSSSLLRISFDRSIASFAATDRLIELARASAREGAHPPERDGEKTADVDRRLAVSIAVALYLGWVAIEPWLLKATGLEDLDDEAIRAGLERATRILFEGWPLVPADAGTAD